MTEAKTYTKLFTAKMIAAKLSKKTGDKYIPVGPSAVDGTFTVELEVAQPVVKKARKSKAPEGGNLGSQIPCGEASREEQLAAINLFAKLTGHQIMEDALAAMTEEAITKMLGKTKTRWGAIGNLRAILGL